MIIERHDTNEQKAADIRAGGFYAKFEDGEASKAVYSPNIGSTIQKSGLTVTYNFN